MYLGIEPGWGYQSFLPTVLDKQLTCNNPFRWKAIWNKQICYRRHAIVSIGVDICYVDAFDFKYAVAIEEAKTKINFAL